MLRNSNLLNVKTQNNQNDKIEYKFYKHIAKLRKF